MAHDLEMKDGNASMMYTGDTPWHGLGTRVDHITTASEAIELAGLDWEVEPTPIYTKQGNDFVQVPKRASITRKTDGKSFGVVSNGYKPVQNHESFTFFDNLVDSGDAKYETAGALSGGQRIWITAKIGDTMQIAGEDSHDMYLLLTNSHDGKKALQALTTMVRVVCANTETLALRTAKTSWTMNHRRDLAGRVIEARNALALSFNYRDAFEAEVEKMLAIEMNVDQFRATIDKVLPEQKFQKEKAEVALTQLFESSPTIVDANGQGNGWGAMNAMTEYLSHKNARTQEARFISNVFGASVKMRSDMHHAILANA